MALLEISGFSLNSLVDLQTLGDRVIEGVGDQQDYTIPVIYGKSGSFDFGDTSDVYGLGTALVMGAVFDYTNGTLLTDSEDLTPDPSIIVLSEIVNDGQGNPLVHPVINSDTIYLYLISAYGDLGGGDTLIHLNMMTTASLSQVYGFFNQLFDMGFFDAVVIHASAMLYGETNSYSLTDPSTWNLTYYNYYWGDESLVPDYGDTVPVPVAIQIIEPVLDDTYTNTLTAQVSVSNPLDDTKRVRISVDGGSWLECEYNAVSGYWEYSINTKLYANDQHAFDAKAIR